MKTKHSNLIFTSSLSAALLASCFAMAKMDVQSPLNERLSKPKEQRLKDATQNRVIITFKKSKSVNKKIDSKLSFSNLVNEKSLKYKTNVKHLFPNSNAMVAVLTETQLKAFSEDPDVERIEEDPIRYKHAGPEFEVTPPGIIEVQATQVSDAYAHNRKVCIIDTGYNINHEDLISNGVTGESPWGGSNYWRSDVNGHGSHVAGIISAIGYNQTGVMGTIRNGNASLHIVQMPGTGYYASDIAHAVNRCVNANAKLINISSGGYNHSVIEHNAFKNAASKGILSIASAGNQGNTALSYPASYSEVISVAAVNRSNQHLSFSQRNNQVELAAPGENIESTYVYPNRYAKKTGTSMAAPHVTGVAALVWSHYTQCSANQIRKALNSTALDRGAAGRDIYYGYGVVKAKAAFNYLASSCDGPSGGEGALPKPKITSLKFNGNGHPVVSAISNSHANQLKVQRAISTGEFVTIATIYSGQSYTDNSRMFGQAPYTTYTHYRVIAVDGNQQSQPSSSLSLKTRAFIDDF